MAKLSVCVITKNESRNISRLLRSVSWADECIVVDSGSTDDTVEIAKTLGARVYIRDWPGWAIQKNRAIDSASHDWILSLDADEWLDGDAELTIRKVINTEKSDSYRLARRTTFLGRWIRHCGWYPDRQVRLFRKSATRFEEVPVHEKVVETPLTTDITVDIWHESYVTLAEWFVKNKKYAFSQAQQKRSLRNMCINLTVKGPLRFVHVYIVQKGFLDGWRGLLLSILRAYYEYLVGWNMLVLQLGLAKGNRE